MHIIDETRTGTAVPLETLKCGDFFKSASPSAAHHLCLITSLPPNDQACIVFDCVEHIAVTLNRDAMVYKATVKLSISDYE